MLPPSRRAISPASVELKAISPRGTGTPCFARMALAWYSWIFIVIRRRLMLVARPRGRQDANGSLDPNRRGRFVAAGIAGDDGMMPGSHGPVERRLSAADADALAVDAPLDRPRGVRRRAKRQGLELPPQRGIDQVDGT